jgi:hypothetical protein
VLRLAVGAMDHGPEGWDEAFNDSFEAENEYPEALPAVAAVGTRFFLDHFAELIPSLPVHVAGHPPGLVVVLHAIGIDSGTGAAAFLIATGVLGVPLTYALARRLLDEDRARVAGLLAAFAPATMLYGVTAADILFATLGTLAALLLLSAPRVAATAGAAALAVGSFFSYALLAIGAWAALVRLDRGGLRVAVAVAAACGVALVLLYAGLYALVGFDMPGAIRRTADVYEVSVAQSRPYGFWVFGSAAAFLAFLGLPLTWYAARAAGERNAAALAPRLRHRRLDGRRLHEGRDRAHLAHVRAARVRRGGRGPPAAARAARARAARRPGVRRGARVRHRLVT